MQSALELLRVRARPQAALLEQSSEAVPAQSETFVTRMVPLRGFLPKDSRGQIACWLREQLPRRAQTQFADLAPHHREAVDRSVKIALDVVGNIETLAGAHPFLSLGQDESERVTAAGLQFVDALPARDLLLHIGMLALSLGWNDEAHTIVEAVRRLCPVPAQVGAWMAGIYAYTDRHDAAQATIEGSLCEGLDREERRKLLLSLYRLRESASRASML